MRYPSDNMSETAAWITMWVGIYLLVGSGWVLVACGAIWIFAIVWEELK